MEFYCNNIKNPAPARLNQELHDEDGFLPLNASLSLYHRGRFMNYLRETQVRKAFAAVAANNAAKKGERDGRTK